MEAANDKAIPAKAILAILLLCFMLGCGDDGFIFVSFSSGVVISNGACGGQFNMRNDGGLTLIVVIGSGTSILLPNGNPGTCANIQAGTRAGVRGPTQNGRVTANQVQLQ